jgi:hypothetical protein
MDFVRKKKCGVYLQIEIKNWLRVPCYLGATFGVLGISLNDASALF